MNECVGQLVPEKYAKTAHRNMSYLGREHTLKKEEEEEEGGKRKNKHKTKSNKKDRIHRTVASCCCGCFFN